MNENGEDYPFFIAAKKYSLREIDRPNEGKTPVTILALHSTSFHKETWEPTLEALFEAIVLWGAEKVEVREVWAVDCPNHGHSGVLNAEILKDDSGFSCERYAAAVHRFLTRAPEVFGVDFGKRRLVGIGHSLGANALLLLQGMKPDFPFISLIIVEPMVSPGGDQPLTELRKRLGRGAERRTSEWSDRETAHKSLVSHPQVAQWDVRVIKAFVNHAITEKASSNTVRLACAPEQEKAMYFDIPGATRPVEELTRLCSLLPVHLIIGQDKDFVPKEVHEALVDPSSGRKFASVTEINEVGHLIPQRIPDKLGCLFYKILASITDRSAKL
ncbi:hypothetical protein AGABI1DRAFT_131612 [Agaricus bisporus var. burnettii JB137-S8]|uniref:AB hydrolase-1 domain-containing protein n=1 Tax=Agaricus bisporus var. burnettii (strain JB137-S8 / ATCC MYA-4627 / FGSC 10392) TaxID=597362 RepID=K5WZ62_AGABU|nr:uncharacterized protein AGABI1DRAFT_131612 [Agaricus bisporus var. burnettii JB137-S8]EKM76093.1 hypothetical protein AGABI1DRAFT_131612 [Agaricus bisporus var. burnettii JB137-S8]